METARLERQADKRAAAEVGRMRSWWGGVVKKMDAKHKAEGGLRAEWR